MAAVPELDDSVGFPGRDAEFADRPEASDCMGMGLVCKDFGGCLLD